MLLGMVPLSWLLLKDLHSEQAIAVNMNEPVRTCGFGRPERLPPPRARGGGGRGNCITVAGRRHRRPAHSENKGRSVMKLGMVPLNWLSFNELHRKGAGASETVMHSGCRGASQRAESSAF